VLAHPATNLPDTRLVWLDRAGRLLDTVPLAPAGYLNPSLSPDGRRAAVAKANSPTSFDLWLVDLQRAVTTRLTFDGKVAGGGGTGITAIWSPDGSRVAYLCNCSGSGRWDVYQVLATGAGRPEPLVQSDVVFKYPAVWSPDGKYMIFSQNAETTQWDLWLLPMQGDRKPRPYMRSPFDEMTATISPDGRWLAYDSDETGRPEIYVRSFPEPKEKHRVSISGGTSAKWSNDGRELLIWTSSQFYITVGPVFSVDVQTNPSFKAGTPRLLFTPRQDLAGISATADLQRFLAAVPVEGAAPPSITVIMNWQRMLEP
jgi:Tol biopolymer transport system component